MGGDMKIEIGKKYWTQSINHNIQPIVSEVLDIIGRRFSSKSYLVRPVDTKYIKFTEHNVGFIGKHNFVQEYKE